MSTSSQFATESFGVELLPVDAPLLDAMLAFGAVHYAETDPYRSRAYRKWLFLQNPHGPALATIIRHGDALIGQAALIPVRFRMPGGGHQLGHFVVDVLTHPDYRNQRLFSRLIDAMKAAAARDGTWLLGHPNAAALRGWQRHEMQFRPALEPSVLLPALQPGVRWERDPARILALWQTHATLMGLGDVPEIDRTADYIEWRFHRRPDKRYRTGLLLDRDAQPLAWQADTVWRHGLKLLVDHASARPTALSAGLGTLALLPPGEPLARNAFRLPVSKRIPFFLTDPAGSDVDCRRVTLAASDF